MKIRSQFKTRNQTNNELFYRIDIISDMFCSMDHRVPASLVGTWEL